MNLASTLRHLPAALLAATVTIACGPKNGSDDAGAGSESSSGGTTVTAECTPGDTKSGDGDCSSCVCSDQGAWQCNRCSPTGGPLETSTGASTTDATSTIGETTTGETTTGATTASATTTGASTETTAGETADTTTGDGLLPSCFDLTPSDDFTIFSAQIVGDELVVEVGYSGGCETHDFTFCFDSFVLDTHLINLAIDHDAHGDACEAFIMEMHKFDLTPVQKVGPSPLEFILLGFKGDSFIYEF